MSNFLKLVTDADIGSVDGLERAENELRELTKSLHKDIETTYWELGRCLYEIYDGVPGGYRDLMKGGGSRAVRKELFRKWGYDSFAEYCEKEVGVMKRSAENLRYAYYWFEIHLAGLPTDVKQGIKELGRSKVYQLAGFVDRDGVISWTEKAKNMTFEELKKAIRAAKVVREEAAAVASGNEERKVAPAPEQLHTVQTSLYSGQYDTWSAALDRAKTLSRSDKIGHNLELICQDFLASNDFANDEDEDRRQYIAKVERRLGLKLIVIDPSTGSPVYGSELLWMLVNENNNGNKKSDPEF